MSAIAVLAGVSAAGVATSAYGQYQAGQAASAQAKSQQAMAQYNAKVQEQQARAIEQSTLYKQQLASQEASRRQGALLAALGASGVVPSEGTPLLLQGRQAAEDALNNLMIGYQGQTQAAQARSQGTIDTMQASYYGQAADNASTASLVGSGGTLLTGLGDIGMTGWKYGMFEQTEQQKWNKISRGW